MATYMKFLNLFERHYPSFNCHSPLVTRKSLPISTRHPLWDVLQSRNEIDEKGPWSSCGCKSHCHFDWTSDKGIVLSLRFDTVGGLEQDVGDETSYRIQSSVFPIMRC